MSIIDWVSKRSIRQMFTAYFRARSQQATQAWFVGRLGHNYGFFSQAVDMNGKREIKAVADTSTQVPAHMAQDINGDGQINCLDVAIVKAALGTHPGQPNWNPAADLNGDGVVDVRDLSAVTQKLLPGTNCNQRHWTGHLHRGGVFPAIPKMTPAC